MALGGAGMARQEASPADPIGALLQSQSADDQLDEPAASSPSREQTRPAQQTPTQALNAPPAGAPQTAATPPSSPPPPPPPAVEVDEAPLIEEQPATVEQAAAPVPVAESPTSRRQRQPVAVVRAIDKISAETMTFEVRVGGPPVRFRNNLTVSARACEVSASDEPIRDSAAYLEISAQPRTGRGRGETRQLFRGWMFASTPSLNPLEHPIYDAWVIGCRAA